MASLGGPMISVIMLTYNREEFVSRAIESILAQTYRDFEFIIIDNGSTDRSGAIADEYAVKDNRICVIHRARGNIGAGRNTGLDAARGEYITFIDDDDWTEPDFLEFLYRLAVDHHADVAICGAADKVFDEKQVMTAEEALIELMWRKKYNMAFPTKLFRCELMENLRFPEDGAYDDIALMYRLLAGAKRVAYHGLPKYTFYRHEGNNSAWTTNHELLTSEILDEYLHAYRVRTEWLSERFPNSAPTWRYFEWSFMISMVEKINRMGITGCERQLSEMRTELHTHQREFLGAPERMEFEKLWMTRYVIGVREDNRVNLPQTDCVGCGACQNICPVGAIRMTADSEGFLHPEIQVASCTNCGVCIVHCPVSAEEHRHFQEGSPLAVYAGWSMDAETRKSSSSGGIFSELARYILEHGGYVAGAAFTEDHGVKHQLISHLEDLPKLKKSKYLQSDIGNVFTDIQRLLHEQKYVLFVGTPCQCAGLHSYLGEKPPTLFLCDFICHGVNSPLVHRLYINEVERKMGGKVTGIDHRDKDCGWEKYQFSIWCEGYKKMLGGKYSNPFLRGFLTNLYLRPSCFQCKFKGTDRPTDLTLGDCWGYPGSEPLGVSLLMIHTQAGMFLLKKMETCIHLERYSMEDILAKNPSIYRCAADRFKERNTFFNRLSENGSLEKTVVEILDWAKN